MIFNRAGGGGEKVKIDGKKVTEKLNLRKGIGNVEGLADFMQNSNVLGYKGNEFYIFNETSLYKGNPYETWTLICNFNNLEPACKANELKNFEITEDGFIITFLHRESLPSSNYTYRVVEYSIKNNIATLSKNMDVYYDKRTIFKINGEIYLIDNNSRFYKIENDNITDINISLSRIRANVSFKNAQYFVSTIGSASSTPGMWIYKFDGSELIEQEFKYNYNKWQIDDSYFYANSIQVNPEHIFILIKNKNGTLFELMDESFEIIDKKYDFPNNWVQFFCKKENGKIKYIIPRNNPHKTVEFPVDVYQKL